MILKKSEQSEFHLVVSVDTIILERSVVCARNRGPTDFSRIMREETSIIARGTLIVMIETYQTYLAVNTNKLMFGYITWGRENS